MLIAATISFQCYHIHYLKFFSKQNLKLISTPTHLQLQLIHTKISDYLKYVPYTTLSKVICILHSASLTCQTVRLNELSLLALAYFMLVCKCYLVINFWTPRCKRWKNGTKFQSQEVILSSQTKQLNIYWRQETTFWHKQENRFLNNVCNATGYMQ